MYKGGIGNSSSTLDLNREEYLLGKPIDRYVDVLVQEKERTEDASNKCDGALFMNQNKTSFAKDLATKIKDDPLFAIKQKECQLKQLIVNNPLKQMKLVKLLERKQNHSSIRSRIKSSPKKHRITLKDKRPNSATHKTTSHHPKYEHDIEMSDVNVPTYNKQKNLSSKRSYHKHRTTDAITLTKNANNNYNPHKYMSSSRKRSHSMRNQFSPDELKRRQEEMLLIGSARKQELKTRVEKMREQEKVNEDFDKEDSHKYGYTHQLRQDNLNSYRGLNLDDSIKRVKYKVQRNGSLLENDYFLKK